MADLLQSLAKKQNYIFYKHVTLLQCNPQAGEIVLSPYRPTSLIPSNNNRHRCFDSEILDAAGTSSKHALPRRLFYEDLSSLNIVFFKDHSGSLIILDIIIKHEQRSAELNLNFHTLDCFFKYMYARLAKLDGS